jgi:hypothetical protein
MVGAVASFSSFCRKRVERSRVERSLYQRAVGYSYEAVRIFMPAGHNKPVYAPCIEHVPPDTTAGIFWSKNRMPERWRDQQNIEHTLGKYIISDKPMTEEEWARTRATVLDVPKQLTVDVEPKLPDGYEMNQELSDRYKKR